MRLAGRRPPPGKPTHAVVPSPAPSPPPPPSAQEVSDVSGGCGTSFKLTVVSTAFEGHRLLARQRLVYTALAPVMPDIHAVLMTLKTPSQVGEAGGAAAAAAAAAPPPTPSGG